MIMPFVALLVPTLCVGTVYVPLRGVRAVDRADHYRFA